MVLPLAMGSLRSYNCNETETSILFLKQNKGLVFPKLSNLRSSENRMLPKPKTESSVKKNTKSETQKLDLWSQNICLACHQWRSWYVSWPLKHGSHTQYSSCQSLINILLSIAGISELHNILFSEEWVWKANILKKGGH